jgi:release factor glutamine methyltransferase
MTIREILAEGKRLLQTPSPASFIDTPALDAALLLSEILHIRREDLFVRENEQISEADRDNYFRLLERRRSGECVAYILGRREFRGLEFTVNPQVLVPRPDTETLVEAALEYIGCITKQERAGLSLLDLCTGSGAVAISLADSLKNEVPFLRISASDVSAGALETAGLNAARLLAGGPDGGACPAVLISFINSDLFENIQDKFDIIVSNPPYVPSGELSSLAPELQREPALALDGGEDGLALIRKIISQAQDHLLPNGMLFLEADPRQMPAIRTLLETHGFCSIRIHKDLADRDRVIAAKLAGNL